MHWILWTITLLALLVSLLASRRRTLLALVGAAKRIWKITPLFLLVMGGFALSVAVVPEETIRNSIGADSGAGGLALATAIGSLAVMPGFVAFPLCAALRSQAVPFFILAAFSTALMNVGVSTFPMDNHYLGWRVAVVRNVIGLFASILVAAVVGIAFGEVAWPW